MKKRNIIFCHVDQLTQKAIGAYGCKEAKTPAMDQLIDEGVSFMDSFSANPISCPARTCWYTGRMSSEHGTLTNREPMERHLPDIGQWMSSRGYGCFYAGKWHVHRNVAESFRILHPQFPLGEQYDASVARVAEAFLENYDSDEPFFLNLGLLNPHDCCYLDLSENMDHLATKFGVERHFPEGIPERMTSFDPTRPMETRQAREWTPEQVDLYRYYYFRMTEMVDAEVGRIYDALKHSRFADNTVFIFSADHGEMMSGHNLFKKSKHYDEALKVPLVVVEPGVAGGRRDHDHLIAGVDFAPTILDYAGVEPMPEMTVAESFRPLVAGRAIPWREVVPAEIFQGGAQTVLTDSRYKYNYHHPTGRIFLHDRKEDPDELRNLAGDPALRGVLDRFAKRLEEYRNTIVPSPEYIRVMAEAEKRG